MIFSTMALGQQTSAPVTPAPSQPDAAILAASETYRRSVLDSNAQALAALYREDAVEMPFSGPPIKGRDAIARFYQGMFSSPAKVTAFTFIHWETMAQGDIAFDIGSYKRTTATGPSGPIEAAGTYMVILKRTAGKWKIAYITYNCDCPPPGTALPR
jgi:uncharacterized protein (TIGR02246 family)